MTDPLQFLRITDFQCETDNLKKLQGHKFSKRPSLKKKEREEGNKKITYAGSIFAA